VEFRFLMGLGPTRSARALGGFLMTKALVAANATFNRAERSTPEETLPPVFQPDTLLPVQYYAALRSKQFLEGEKLLMFVILQQSVEDYMKYVNSPKESLHKCFGSGINR
jgi:hypothetical protein